MSSGSLEELDFVFIEIDSANLSIDEERHFGGGPSSADDID